MKFTTLGELLRSAEAALLEAKVYFGHGTNNAWDEAVAIARFVLDLPPDARREELNRIVSVEEQQAFKTLLNRRLEERIPVPYLTHEAWFAGLKFYVDERVIIPRSPLAELIENQFQPWIKGGKGTGGKETKGSKGAKEQSIRRILDLCTGSACIAIACAKAFPDAKIDAVDISKEALEVAKINVERFKCQKNVHLIEANLFSGCHGKYDIIISNPPYVDERDLKELPKEYLFEPVLALEAGKDGLTIVKNILNDAPQFLSPNGLLVVEVGNSEKALRKQYPNLPFHWLDFKRGGQGVFILEKSCWQAS